MTTPIRRSRDRRLCTNAMPWIRTIRDAIGPEAYLERTLHWYRSSYERLRNATSESMLHTLLANMFLLWEKENPSPALVQGSKNLSWAYDVTQYFACLPPREAVELLAMFAAIEQRPSLSKRNNVMARYTSLMEMLGGGVERNSLVQMYQKQNLEPSGNEKQFYDRAVQKLFVRAINGNDLGSQEFR